MPPSDGGNDRKHDVKEYHNQAYMNNIIEHKSSILHKSKISYIDIGINTYLQSSEKLRQNIINIKK